MTKKERTRKKIIDISRILFTKYGYNRVTMKDVCEATGLSRGGLYSHFDSVRSIFEALMEELNKNTVLDFSTEIEEGKSAVQILENALSLLEEEMNHPEDSLSLAMVEYAKSEDSNIMEDLNRKGKKKWTMLLQYGMERKEFREVEIEEIVNMILYVYQGVRLWSCIVPISNQTIESIINNIRRQVMKGDSYDF
ncbi:MAG: TetR/AcrR family transcriptional regulator [Bacillota bacterium]|nr:TetR/AcrR family transcriptional regulator [Bacillota bacterium]